MRIKTCQVRAEGTTCTSTDQILGTLHTEQLELPEALTEAYGVSVRSMVAVLTTLAAQTATLEAEVQRCFGQQSSLSVRELEVLRLVSQGCTDAQIAQRLTLSSHTVHRHVSNIRTKLGVSSRAAAAAWAARQTGCKATRFGSRKSRIDE